MPQIPTSSVISEYPFLDDRSAQEPFLFEILNEIRRYQKEFALKGNESFATRDHVMTARTISMPVSPSREKNIDYLLELLAKRFPTNITMIPTFEFKLDDGTKKLSLVEKEEYALNLSIEDVDRIICSRNNTSLENFTQFIKKFRMFNLDKVVQRARNREGLTKVIALGLNKYFFTYNHVIIDKRGGSTSEEYCFHAENYEHVKKSLNLLTLRSYIATYNEFVKSRLRKYGIINSDFTDYRDNKIEYILSVFINDLSSIISPSDLMAIKNFKSLRDCILAVDKLLNPAQTKSSDIITFIRANKSAGADEILCGVMDMTKEILSDWDKPDRLFKERIYRFIDSNGNAYYNDAPSLPLYFQTVLSEFKSIDPETPGYAKSKPALKAEILYKASRQLLVDPNINIYIENETDRSRLSSLCHEYELYLKKISVQSEIKRSESEFRPSKPSVIARILSMFMSLFSRKDHSYDMTLHEDAIPVFEQPEKPVEPARETKEINEKAAARRGPIVALSDLIEFKPENDPMINRIITELRTNNMRLVIPIYNARSTLYPKRSSKLLMSDIEYLLVPIHVIKSMESISEFLNAITGFKLKDEVIPGKALVAIEKYLQIIYRQRRSSQSRKKDMRGKSLQK